MTVISGYGGSGADDQVADVDLEEEAQRALEQLRQDPAGERLAEMLPDLLLIGVSYAADLFTLMKRYRRLTAEMQRRQYAREDARRLQSRAVPGLRAAIEASREGLSKTTEEKGT